MNVYFWRITLHYCIAILYKLNSFLYNMVTVPQSLRECENLGPGRDKI